VCGGVPKFLQCTTYTEAVNVSAAQQPSPAVSIDVPDSLEAGLTYTGTVTLNNQSAEPGAPIDYGSGIHVRLENATFVSADSGEFDAAKAFNTSANDIAVNGALILEFSSANFPNNTSRSGTFTFRVDEGTIDEVVLRYRGWIFDPNETVDGEEYVVHAPPQGSNRGSVCGGVPKFLQCTTYKTTYVFTKAGIGTIDVLAEFGLLQVTVTGADGALLNTDVNLFDANGNYLLDRDTGSDGVTSFSLAEGTYGISVCEDNCIPIQDVEIRTLESIVIEIQI
jgi:hypothetical protein